jgi:hypothetical protein
MSRKRTLSLCTGDSAHGQMAEGLVDPSLMKYWLVPDEPGRDAQCPDAPLCSTDDEEGAAMQEQAQQDLTFWAHVLESAHDEETRSFALAGYQFAALQLIFGGL